MISFLKKLILGNHSDYKLKQYSKRLSAINELSDKFANYSEADCQKKTAEFKQRLKDGENLDNLLPEAFALVRRAAKATLNEVHFDVQLLGGMALHEGSIAEMKTGEGKTLTSTLPVYLNALVGKGVHLVTVNDYLAKRDTEWMGAVYNFLGLSVGLIVHGLDDEQRREAYKCDITYGTNNEFGFDYLRDNMKYHLENCVQRGHHFAIVDEVDSILIDEARTPLIISGPAEGNTDKYHIINRHIRGLTRARRVIDDPDPKKVAAFCKIDEKDVPGFLSEKKDFEVVTSGDYTFDEKGRHIQLTESGIEKMEQRISGQLTSGSLYDPSNIEYLHHVNQALKAHYVFKKDIDYVVRDQQVMIVDEFTGRIMEGRRYSDGLHQAIEAKEDVRVEKENQTLASITYQNYFRKYTKLSGMTGTAATEENEFIKIYGLGVIVIPTHRKINRVDHQDMIYANMNAKHKAISDKVVELSKKGQPVLLGTDSIEQSEALSKLLKSNKIVHSILNAKFHEQEAEIIAQAGQRGTVTISTNMAGRGTDIKLGEGVEKIGGLFVLGTVRHESRRIDNQLRGRSGRQGDKGETLFILSLEDHLLQVFGSDRIKGMMKRLNFQDDEAIVHPWISKAIENAQKKVEGHNFLIRKHLLEYDDVMNRQRQIIYDQRKEILGGTIKDFIFHMAHEVVDDLLNSFCNDRDIDNWDFPTFLLEFRRIFNCPDWEPEAEISRNPDQIKNEVRAQINELYLQKTEKFGEDVELIQKQILLNITDNLWKEHLLLMDQLREGIGLRSFAQKNPLDEYRREAFTMFSGLMSNISEKTCFIFFRAEIRENNSEELRERKLQTDKLTYQHGAAAAPDKKVAPPKSKPVVAGEKIKRNEPCPCGSGKKYKNCDCEWKKNLEK